MNKETTQPVTLDRVARELGCSLTTAWRAFNNKGRVSPRTRKAVLQKAAELGYAPSMVGQTLARGKTKTLGVIVPRLDSNIWAGLVHSVEQEAYVRGYNIIVCNTHLDQKRESKYVELLIRRRVEGVLLAPFGVHSRGDYDHVLGLRKFGIPVILMEQNVVDDRLIRVVADNFNAAKALGEHLFSVGHRRIGFFHGDAVKWNAAEQERLQGYKKALNENGIKFDPALSLMATRSSLEDSETVFFDRISEYLRRTNRPTAIICSSDMLAIKSMAIAREMGMHIPQDIAFAGFDDSLMAPYAVPPLTTVRQPTEEIGQRATEILFKQIDRNVPENIPSCCIRESMKLIIRKSCGFGFKVN